MKSSGIGSPVRRKGAWEVTKYEIKMLESLAEGASSGVLQNALTECQVLHARQLCEIFLSRGWESDGIRLSHLVAEADQTERLKQLVHELYEVYGNRQLKQSPYWAFHKMLQDPTAPRGDGYGYEPALDLVRPILRKIISEIEFIRRQEFDRQPRS